MVEPNFDLQCDFSHHPNSNSTVEEPNGKTTSLTLEICPCGPRSLRLLIHRVLTGCTSSDNYQCLTFATSFPSSDFVLRPPPWAFLVSSTDVTEWTFDFKPSTHSTVPTHEHMPSEVLDKVLAPILMCWSFACATRKAPLDPQCVVRLLETLFTLFKTRLPNDPNYHEALWKMLGQTLTNMVLGRYGAWCLSLELPQNHDGMMAAAASPPANGSADSSMPSNWSGTDQVRTIVSSQSEENFKNQQRKKRLNQTGDAESMNQKKKRSNSTAAADSTFGWDGFW